MAAGGASVLESATVTIGAAAGGPGRRASDEKLWISPPRARDVVSGIRGIKIRSGSAIASAPRERPRSLDESTNDTRVRDYFVTKAYPFDSMHAENSVLSGTIFLPPISPRPRESPRRTPAPR